MLLNVGIFTCFQMEQHLLHRVTQTVVITANDFVSETRLCVVNACSIGKHVMEIYC